MSPGQFIVCNSSGCKISLVKIFFFSIKQCFSHGSLTMDSKYLCSTRRSSSQLLRSSSRGALARESQEKLHFVLINSDLVLHPQLCNGSPSVRTLGHSCFQFIIAQLMFRETELFAVFELFYSKETDIWTFLDLPLNGRMLWVLGSH